MKLRIRYQRRTQAINLTGEPLTYGALKQRVASLYGFSDNGDTGDFQLSLNGQDATSAEPGTALAELGIVSGDLIIVLTPSPPFAQDQVSHHAPASLSDTGSGQSVRRTSSSPMECMPPEEKSPTHGKDGQLMVISQAQNNSPEAEKPGTSGVQNKGESSSSKTDEANAMETMAAAIAADEEAVMDSEVNRYLREPMLIRDSSSGAIPQPLKRAFELASPSNQHEAFCVLLHVLMTESGFISKEASATSEEPPPCHQLPEGWRAAGFYTLRYMHPKCVTQAVFTVTCVPMQSQVIIHGTMKWDDTSHKCQMKCKCSQYITTDLKEPSRAYIGASLSVLSACFKDGIAYPLLQAATDDMEESIPVPSLCNLVFEIKLLILQNLSAVNLLRLSQTCQELNEVAKQPYLWRRLYLRDFGRRPNNDLSQDWIKLYRDKYTERKRLRDQLRLMTPIVPPWVGGPGGYFGGGVPMPGPPPYPPGFIIGGDYDRDPYFGGIPGPLGGPRVPMPGPGFPRPRFDPIGPLPNQRFRPGRGGGMWEAGSRSRGRGGFGGFGPRMF